MPRQRSFPPAMSVIATIGFVLGALAASGWVIAAGRASPDGSEPQPADSDRKTPEPSKPAAEARPRPQPVLAAVEKPLIARLQESDVCGRSAES